MIENIKKVVETHKYKEHRPYRDNKREKQTKRLRMVRESLNERLSNTSPIKIEAKRILIH